jgi:hypothetical protein
MIRSFCFGSILGFAFGTSKQGTQVRQSIDGFITALLKNDDQGADSFDQPEKPTGFEQPGNQSSNRGNGNGRKNETTAASPRKEETERQDGKRAQAVAEHKQESNEGHTKRSKKDESGVSLDKMHEMAEALNAKPTAPETDELEPS